MLKHAVDSGRTFHYDGNGGRMDIYITCYPSTCTSLDLPECREISVPWYSITVLYLNWEEDSNHSVYFLIYKKIQASDRFCFKVLVTRACKIWHACRNYGLSNEQLFAETVRSVYGIPGSHIIEGYSICSLTSILCCFLSLWYLGCNVPSG